MKMYKKQSTTTLFDLPDEILLFIFRKLSNTDVLYSLIDVNIRLDQIVTDPVFTSHLKLLRRSSNGFIYPMTDQTLERFCRRILPQINSRIQWLNLEPSSMQRILVLNYPNLYGLGLFNITSETVNCFLDGKKFSINNFPPA